MKLVIGTDHRGLELKKDIIKNLSKEFELVDLSAGDFDIYDYPDFAFKVAHYVLENENSYGVLICGTGIGMSIAANKVKGIRCALIHNIDEAKLAKEHNNANIIALNSNMDGMLAIECIKTFIDTKFSQEEKHHRRIKKIINYESGTYNEL